MHHGALSRLERSMHPQCIGLRAITKCDVSGSDPRMLDQVRGLRVIAKVFDTRDDSVLIFSKDQNTVRSMHLVHRSSRHR